MRLKKKWKKKKENIHRVGLKTTVWQLQYIHCLTSQQLKEKSKTSATVSENPTLKLFWVYSTELLKCSCSLMPFAPQTNGEQLNLKDKLRCHGKNVKTFSGRRQVDVLLGVCLSFNSLNGGHHSSPVSLVGLQDLWVSIWRLHRPIWPGEPYWTGVGERPFCCLPLSHMSDPFPFSFQVLFVDAVACTAAGVWLSELLISKYGLFRPKMLQTIPQT